MRAQAPDKHISDLRGCVSFAVCRCGNGRQKMIEYIGYLWAEARAYAVCDVPVPDPINSSRSDDLKSLYERMG